MKDQTPPHVTEPCGGVFRLRLFVQFQEVLEVGICGDTFQLVGHDPFDILLDAVVVLLHHFLHVIHPFVIHKVGDDGNLPVSLFLFGHLLRINDNLTMEDFLLYLLAEVIGDGADEHPLCQAGNLTRRYEGVHLRGYGGGNILPVDGDGLAFLEYLAEPLAEGFGRFPHDLPREDVADGIDNHFRLLVRVVTDKLAEILKAQQNGYLRVPARSCGTRGSWHWQSVP